MIPALLVSLLAASPAAAVPPCTLETSIRADLRGIARLPDKYYDRCVRLDGYLSYNRFYQDVAGFYRSQATDSEDRPNDGWLGLYFLRDEDYRRGPMRRATIVGILGSCKRAYEAATARLKPNEMVFMTGFCHSSHGLTLKRVQAFAQEGARFRRQTGEEARRTFGDLEPESATNPVPDAVRERVAAWKDAFLAGDGPALTSLVTPYDWTKEEKPELERRFEAVLKGDEGVFSILRGRRLDSVYFRSRADKEQRSYGDKGDWFACICKSDDCTGRWPIAAMDAKALESRPYVCFRVFDSVDRPHRLELGMEIVDNGLLEP